METEIMSQLPGQYPGPVERGPELPPPPPVYGDLHQPSQLPPPPASAYGPGQPAQQYGQPPQSRRGILGWLLALGVFILGYAKYAILLIKVPFLFPILTLFVSLWAYALLGGWTFAVALLSMLIVHEAGHWIEIRRQGIKASAPLFIPLLGAVIFQRSLATDAMNQARIGIAGPLLGTVGATTAYVLFGSTHWGPFLFAAYIGFYLNLFNLIPFGMLDGGWITAPVSKWLQVAGLVMMLGVALFLPVSPLIWVILVLSLPTAFARFRNAKSDYFGSASSTARLGMGAAWLVLVVFLAFASALTGNEMSSLYRVQ
jgi:Zn-dependent protease